MTQKTEPKKIDRPTGPAVAPLPPGVLPDLRPLPGRWVRLDALNPARHGPQLWNAIKDGKDENGALWTYLPYGPFSDEKTFREWLMPRATQRDPWFYAFVKRDTGEALGMGSYLRGDGPNGVIEIGHIWMSVALQRTRESTEAMYLFMRHAFDDLGMRRLEWKCDALNVPSRSAALRFGFTFEGIFRQHLIYKGRNRDTAWFAIIDKDWPRIRQGFEAWLADGNFDGSGKEKAKLRVS